MGNLESRLPGGCAKAQTSEISVLIIGKSGNGKSSLANTITGTNKFHGGVGEDPHAESVIVMDLPLKVIDTGDVLGYGDKAVEHVQQWRLASGRSPGVIILALRSDLQYTPQEHAIYLRIVRLWGDNLVSFRRRLMVAFTFADLQEEDIKTTLKEAPDLLKKVLKVAKNRYVEVDNEASEAEMETQRESICQMITDIVSSDDCCCTLV